MPADITKPETETEAEDQDSSSVAMGGLAPTNAVTDKWITAMPKADATHPSTLPKAVAATLAVEEPGTAPNPDPDSSSVVMGGMAPTNSVTDMWVTASPKADATHPSSLPKAVRDAIDGKDHSADPPAPDSGGRVLDEVAAAANRPPAE